jgi:hypothetical protein
MFLSLAPIVLCFQHVSHPLSMLMACVADKFYKLGWKKQRKSLFPRHLFEQKEDGGVV